MICGLPKKSRHRDGFGFDSYLSMTRERFFFAIARSAGITSGLQSGTVTDGECSESTGADGAPAPAASDDDDGGESDGEPAPRPPHRSKTSRRVAAPLPCATAQPQATKAEKIPSNTAPPAALWRLPEVLRNVPVSRATLYNWIEQGRFPKPIKIGPRAVAWRSADVLALTV